MEVVPYRINLVVKRVGTKLSVRGSYADAELLSTSTYAELLSTSTYDETGPGIAYEKYTADLDSSPLTTLVESADFGFLIRQQTFLFERSVRRQAIRSIDKAEVEIGWFHYAGIMLIANA